MVKFQHELLQHQITFSLGESPASQVLSPNGKWLVTGSLRGGMIKIWDVQTGHMERSWIAIPLSPYPYINETSLEYGITALAISPDGKTLVTGGKALKTWEFETGKQIRVFKGFGSGVSYITISANGEILLTDGSAGSLAGAMNIWDLRSGKKIRRTLSDGGWVISPDSTAIIGFRMGENEEPPNLVKVWDLITGEKLRVLENSDAITPTHFTFSPDGRLVAGAGVDGIKIWNFETGEQVQRITKHKNVRFHEHLDHVMRCVFSPDGKALLSSGADGSIQIWTIETSQNIGTLRAENRIGWFATSDDGQVIVGISVIDQHNRVVDDRVVEVWKIPSQ
ncbi:MAG: WD40 repeat domain-containing protein [Oculatellaceae cyanobacterium bins.114]|nr:WD40 repeat domain-containing protein [Oculatellaceae cyanobacterium bins.114]